MHRNAIVAQGTLREAAVIERKETAHAGRVRDGEACPKTGYPVMGRYRYLLCRYLL